MIHWYKIKFFGFYNKKPIVAYREGQTIAGVLAEFNETEVESISRVTVANLDRPFSEVLREMEGVELPRWVFDSYVQALTA